MPAGYGGSGGLRAKAHGGPGRAGLRSESSVAASCKVCRWRQLGASQLCQQPTVTVFSRSRLGPFLGRSEIGTETRARFRNGFRDYM
jgi:hypothetical protein